MREAEVGIANTKDVPRLAQRFEDALVFAARLHASDIRKGTTIPYLAHLLGTASIALEHGATEDEAIAALLHDAVEDHGPGELVKIRERFGDVVADIVAGCTDADVTPKPPWRVRKETYVRHLQDAPPSVRLVSASDKLHNARAILSDYRDRRRAVESVPRRQGGHAVVLPRARRGIPQGGNDAAHRRARPAGLRAGAPRRQIVRFQRSWRHSRALHEAAGTETDAGKPTLARVLLSTLVVLTIASTVDARGPKAGITFYTVERPVETFGPLTVASISVSCEDGDQVLSGGYVHTKDQPDLQVSGSAPTGDGAWLVQIQNFSETAGLPGRALRAVRAADAVKMR